MSNFDCEVLIVGAGPAWRRRWPLRKVVARCE